MQNCIKLDGQLNSLLQMSIQQSKLTRPIDGIASNWNNRRSLLFLCLASNGAFLDVLLWTQVIIFSDLFGKLHILCVTTMCRKPAHLHPTPYIGTKGDKGNKSPWSRYVCRYGVVSVNGVPPYWPQEEPLRSPIVFGIFVIDNTTHYSEWASNILTLTRPIDCETSNWKIRWF